MVAYEGSIYLVSAAHVFDHIEKGIKFYLYADINKKRWLTELPNLTPIPDGGSRDDDPFDVGVLRLKGNGLPPYPNVNCEPLDFARLLASSYPREGKHYLAIGYPTTRTRVNKKSGELKLAPRANTAPSITSERYNQLGIDDHTHIAVDFHKNDVVGKSGLKQTFPDPHGMSGSPLWQHYDENAEENIFGAVQVAGVLTDYHSSKKILLGTDIATAKKLIIESSRT